MSYFQTIISLILLVGVVIIGTSYLESIQNSEDCAISKYNIYSNSTQGYSYFFGECYVDTYNSYETNEVCKGGFLDIGMSCYESKDTHTEVIKGRICFKLKTGERC